MFVPPPDCRRAMSFEIRICSPRGSAARTPALAVERDDGDVVVGRSTSAVTRATPSRLELGALHRARAVDHEDDARLSGCSLIFSRVEPHRHDLLDLGALVAARAERVLAAGHDEPAAHLRDVGVERLPSGRAHEVRRHVGHQHEVELSSSWVAGMPLGRAP
jgi:hypothetical protein